MVKQWWNNGVTMVLQWCYKGVTMVLQWCYYARILSWIIRGNCNKNEKLRRSYIQWTLYNILLKLKSLTQTTNCTSQSRCCIFLMNSQGFVEKLLFRMLYCSSSLWDVSIIRSISPLFRNSHILNFNIIMKCWKIELFSSISCWC